MFQHSAPNKKISVEEILKSVAAVFEVRISEIKGESRHKEIALARQVAMYLAKEMIDDSLDENRRILRRKNPLHASPCVEKNHRSNPDQRNAPPPSTNGKKKHRNYLSCAN